MSVDGSLERTNSWPLRFTDMVVFGTAGALLGTPYGFLGMLAGASTGVAGGSYFYQHQKKHSLDPEG